MPAEEKFDKEIPAPTATGFEDKNVIKALEIMNEWNNLNGSEFNRREYLNKIADEEISNSDSPITTTKKVNSQLSYIAVRKVNKQMAERIFMVTGGKLKPKQRAVIKKAYIRFLEIAGYRNTWLDHVQMLRTGDQFITAGANSKYFEDGKGFPYKIKKKSITQLFFPGWVTSLVDKGDNRHAKTYVEMIFDGEWEDAIIEHPWLLENGGSAGLIPMNQDDLDLNTQKDNQETYNTGRRTQVAQLVSEGKKILVKFGGGTAVTDKPLEGENFPNVDRFGEPTKNIFQKQCFKLSNGLLAGGLLQATHKLSILDGVLQSIGYTFEVINLNAIKIIRTDMNPADFKTQYNEALADQMNMKEGVIYSKGDIAMQSTHAQSFLNEMFASLDQIIKNFARLDIIIDDALTDPGKTLGALEIEQVSQSRGVRELQKQNAPEEQRFHDFTVDWLIQNIEDDNDVELPGINARVFDKEGKEQTVNGLEIEDEFGEKVFVNFTVGNLAQAIRDNGLRFEVVPESGVKINEAVSIARAEKDAARFANLGMRKSTTNALRRIQILQGADETEIDLMEQDEIAEGATGQGVPPAAAPAEIPVNA